VTDVPDGCRFIVSSFERKPAEECSGHALSGQRSRPSRLRTAALSRRFVAEAEITHQQDPYMPVSNLYALNAILNVYF